MTQMQLARRVEELEREMRLLKRKLNGGRSAGKKSADDFFGMFHGDPYFKRAMAHGADYRRSLRPAHAGKRPRKK